MPRITGPTIAAHVAAQEIAVVDAARRLFSERGAAAVTLADIAQEMGLGRTSLYRYFPTKAHIIKRWFDQEMDGLMARSTAAIDGQQDARAALVAWLDVQVDFITDSEHRTLTEAVSSGGELPPDVAAHFARRHIELYATLDRVLAVHARSKDLRRHRALLIAGLIRSSADSLDRGLPMTLVRRELHRTASAVAQL